MLFCFWLKVTPAQYPASKSGHTLGRCEKRVSVCDTFHRCLPSLWLLIYLLSLCDLCLHLWQEASEVYYLLYEEPSPSVSQLAISFTSLFSALSPGYVTNTKYGAQHRPMWKHSQCILSFWWLVIENYILSMSLIMFSPLYLGLFHTIFYSLLMTSGKAFQKLILGKLSCSGLCSTEGMLYARDMIPRGQIIEQNVHIRVWGFFFSSLHGQIHC